jgi:hypothetical protein
VAASLEAEVDVTAARVVAAALAVVGHDRQPQASQHSGIR